jgi:transcriptional regulator with XRE-family HTH domain
VEAKWKMDTVAKVFRPALVTLRSTLGETQEGMAKRLGCTLGAYRQWETGKRSPSGEWLIKILNLCPNKRTLTAFGLANGPVAEILPLQAAPKVDDGSNDVVRNFNLAVTGLNRLYEAARTGNMHAAELLEHVATGVNMAGEVRYRREGLKKRA